MDKALKLKIERYVNRSDREIEPVFVGRQDLFRTVAAAANACADGHPRGQTVCLAGPPGIGKTAFLAALRTRGLSGDWGGPPVLMAEVSPAKLHDPHFVLAAVARALPTSWRNALDERARQSVQDLIRRVVSVSAFGAQVTLSSPNQAAEFLWEGIQRLTPKGHKAVLCICVDEAHKLKPTPGGQDNLDHKLKPTPGGQDNEVLAELHFGCPQDSPPAFALLAGHSQTPNVIETSVSRRLATERLVHMQPLSRSESIEYVRKTLDYCGVRGVGRRRFAEWAADECGGFPHHLRNVMAAVGEEMLRSDAAELSKLDLKRIAADVGRRRTVYYSARLSGLEAARPLINHLLLKWADKPVSLDRAMRDVFDAIGSCSVDDRRFLAGAGLDDYVQLVDRMITKGFLAAVDRDGLKWSCIVPSLCEYARTDRHETRAPNIPSEVLQESN